jgi:hypothetical protein
MKYVSIFTICCMLAMSGCKTTTDPSSEKPTPSVTKNPTSTPVQPQNQNLPSTDTNNQLIASFTNGQKDQLSVYLNVKNEQTPLTIYQSSKKGNIQNQSFLPIKQPWEKEIKKENVFVSFPSDPSDPSLSWILLTSEPAAGQMGKTLYESSDSGKTWTLLGDLSQQINGYVTGIVFRSATDGWISATYHGVVMLPLYRTKDGGKNWAVQTIAIPKEYKYGNVYPPVFDPTNSMQGTLKIQFTGDSGEKTVDYKTTNGGETWEP